MGRKSYGLARVRASKSYLSLSVSRSPKSPPGQSVGNLSTIDDGNTIHKHVADPRRELLWLLVGRVVDDGIRVEDSDIGIHAGSQKAAFIQPNALRRER